MKKNKSILEVYRFFLKTAANSLLVTAVLFWSIGGIILTSETARAAATIAATTLGLPNQPIKASSTATAIAKISATADAVGQTLTAITIAFNEDPISTNKLAAMATDTTSGLALYDDSGGTAGTFDGTDAVVTLGGAPSWNAGASSITLTPATPVSLTNGSPVIFYIVIKTNASIANNASIIPTIPANSVITTNGNGPASQTTLNIFVADTAGPVIQDVIFIDNKNIDVMFNEKIDASTVTSGAFTLTTADAGDNSAISSVTVQPDNKTIRVNSSGANVASTGTDTITVSNAVKDNAGNVNQTTSAINIMSSFNPLVISEIQTSGATADDEFIEIYNRSAQTVNLNSQGLKLHIVNSAGTDANKALTFTNNTIPSNGYFLITPATGYAGATATDATYAASGNMLVDNGSIYISWSATEGAAIVDKIGFGTSTNYEGQAIANLSANQSIERKAHSSATAATMASGGADASNGNNYDSDNNNFDFTVRTSPAPQNSLSATETPGGGGANSAPNIMHSPLFKAVTGSDLTITARIGDSGGNLSNSNTYLYYCGSGAGTACDQESEYTAANGIDIGAGWFKFTVPSASLNATNDLRYFLTAKDNATPALMTVMTNDPTYDTQTFNHSSSSPGDATAAKSFVIDVTASALGSATISGTIQYNSTGLADATVFLEGTPFTTTTDGNGAFTIANVMQGSFNFIVTKNGYIDFWKPGLMIGASGTVDVGTVTMNTGFVGSGGDYSKPSVMWTAPSENMSGAPTNIAINGAPILISFSKEMDATTINTTNIQLKKIVFASDGSASVTPITVSVGYEAQNANITVSSTNYDFGNDAKAVIYSATTLEQNSQYIVEIRNVKDSAGNPLQGNRPNGDYGLMFSTSGTVTLGGQNTFGSGMAFPPFIIGTMPMPGVPNVPLNTKILVKFSEAMDSTTINSTNIKLVSVTNPFTASETESSPISLSSVSLDTTTKSIAILQPSSNLTASANYRVKILGGVKSQKGINMAPPGSESNVMFRGDFKAGTDSDSTAPSINGTYPTSNATDIPVNIGNINVSFSDNIDPSTITSSAVQIKYGSTAIPINLNYEPMERTAEISPKSALTPGATYTISVSTSVTDMAGNTLASAYNSSFQTSSTPDTTAPNIVFANADDYSLAITFTEPMTSVDAIESTFASSIKKLGNYTVKSSAAGTDPSGGTTINLATLSPLPAIEYDNANNTVIIKGIKSDSNWTAGKEFFVQLDNITDLSNNIIASGSKTAKGTIQSIQNTGGMLSSGGPMMSGSAESGFTATSMFNTSKFASEGISFMPPVKVFPFNMMAGLATIYGIELPISKQIDASGTIVLTFPTGFNVSGAKKDTFSPPNNDINGPGAGTVVFATSEGTLPDGASTGGASNDGVYVITSTNTVYVKLGAVPTDSSAHDFLRLDVAGMINSSIPKDYTTSGYKVDIKTKKADGTLLETITSEPFFISGGGSGSLTGTITATGATGGTMKIYLGSPMTGPMEITSNAFSGGSTTYTFSNLPAGEYFLFTDQYIELTGGNFTGLMPPINVNVAGSGTTTKNFTIVGDSTGAAITVNIVGTFSNEQVDIFAGSPSGFRVKTITLNGTFTVGSPSAQSINLPYDDNWFVGMGPAMPKGPMAGPPSMPNWIIPMPQEIRVTGCPSSCSASPNSLTFTATTADKTINGKVVDAAGNSISFAEVYAYSPTGGFGTHSNTKSDGTFEIKLIDGSFVVGAFIPGMPTSREVSVVIKSNNVYINGSTTATALPNAATTLLIKMEKPDYTISGKITDGTNTISNAGVYAYRTDGPGHADVMTGSSGSYTLYVSTGTWKVGAFLPGYGPLTEQTVVISTASVSDINFAPTTGVTYYTIKGRVFKDTVNNNDSYDSGEGISGAFVKIEGNGNYNDAITDADGAYSIKIPAGAYTMRAFAHGYGELPPITNVSISANDSSPDANKSFKIETPQTITINIKDSGGSAITIDKAFIDFFDTTNKFGNHLEITSASSGTLNLPDGSYAVKAYVSGMNIPVANIQSDDDINTVVVSGVLTINGNETIKIVLPTYRAISGIVYANSAGAGNELANAWVEIVNPTTGVHFGTQANSSGAYSMKIADGTYSIMAMKPGYVDEPQTVVIGAAITLNGETVASNAVNLITTATNTTISGQIKIGSAGAANAFVRAEKQGGGFAGAQADANGNYTMYVTNGAWKIYAVSDGYSETAYASNPIIISGSSTSNINITLTQTVSLKSPKNKPITPATGGTFEDSNAGLKMEIPANALGTSSSTGQITAKETNNIRNTSTVSVVGSKGKEIKAYNSDNNPITTLNDNVTLEFKYTKAELGTFDTQTEVDKLEMGSWNESTQQWEVLPTTIVYKDSNGNVVSDPAESLSDIETVTLKANTTHFSLFAPLNPTDPSAPATPTGLSATAASSSQINLSWTANSESDLSGYMIYRSTDNSSFPLLTTTASNSYSNTGLSASTAYYYKITAYDTSNNESAATSAANATTQSNGGAVITIYMTPAKTVAPATTTEQSTTPQTTTQSAENATPTSAIGYNDGDLIKSTNDPKVYIIIGDKKLWIPTAEAFEKSNYKWSEIKIATDSAVAKINSVTLVKITDSPKVYAIINNLKRHIKSPEEFNASGYKWSDIITVSAVQLSAYPEESIIAIKIIINTNKLRVRNANNINGEILDRVSFGEVYEIIAESGGWYKIKTKNDVIGWVSGLYASKQQRQFNK